MGVRPVVGAAPAESCRRTPTPPTPHHALNRRNQPHPHPSSPTLRSYKQELDTSIASASGAAKKTMKSMREVPSAYWIDKKDKIRGNTTESLEGILKDAASYSPAHLVVVIHYDLPNRDCDAKASNGEICCYANAGARPRPYYPRPSPLLPRALLDQLAFFSSGSSVITPRPAPTLIRLRALPLSPIPCRAHPLHPQTARATTPSRATAPRASRITRPTTSTSSQRS